jgi:hypothetical protein
VIIGRTRVGDGISEPACEKDTMAVDASSQIAASNVTGAIRKASQLTGTNFQYLLATAKVESNLNPGAKAPTSSAGGLFQFIDQTWLGTLKESGGALGYGRYANAITRNEAGKFVVENPAMRREIMALRQDPTANAVMAGAFTQSNAAYLKERLGRDATEGELYIAHFMGAGGAARLIERSEAAPGARAADAFPNAARANRSIFFDSNGRARNFAEVARALAGRYQIARTRTATPDNAVAAIPGNGFAAETARVARAYESSAPLKVHVAAGPQQEPVYHNPYRASERREPVSSIVSERWITRPSQTQTASTTTQPSAPVATAAAQAPSPNDVVRAGHDNVRRAYFPTTPPPPPQVASQETLGLFQDMRPNVQALFTRG